MYTYHSLTADEPLAKANVLGNYKMVKYLNTSPFVEKHKPFRREAEKIQRNESCPCGSGLKFKKCCLNKENV